MFTEIDNSIFPDCCEVLEIVPSQHYVFPIYKCGSSSLNRTADEKGWKTLVNDQIGQALSIDVFLREPRDRFISGVNTFVQQTLRDHANLDLDTILFFVKNNLFLNRHYAPQMFWLMNLARYSQAPLTLKHMRDIKYLTTKHHRAGIQKPSEEFMDKIKCFPWAKLELYFFLDQILLDKLEQTLTFNEIVTYIQDQHQELYSLIFERAKKLIDVLPKT